MLRALAHGADGLPPTYYVTAQLWRRIFGGGILSLRLFSSFGMIIGVYALWAGLRRLFSFWASTLAVATLFCTSWMFLLQNSNMRGYGLLVGLCGIAFWLYSLAGDQPAMSPTLFVASVACHAALVLTHPFGIAYSAVFLLAFIVSDYKERHVRWRVCGAIVIGWLALIPWVPVFIRLASINSSRNWVDMPRWQDLLNAYSFQIFWLPTIVLVFVLMGFVLTGGARLGSAPERRSFVPFSLLLLAGLALSFSANFAVYLGPILAIVFMLWLALPSGQGSDLHSRSVLYLAFTLLLVPLALFAISGIWVPAFTFRYLLPSYLAVAILLAATFDKVSAGTIRLRSRLVPQLAWTMMFAAILFSPARAIICAPVSDIPRGGVSARTLNALVPSDKPIVIEDLIAFLPLTMDQSQSGHRYFYLLGAEASHHHSRHAAVINMLTVWYHYGYLRGQILPSEKFLATHHDFLVLQAPEYAADSERFESRISSQGLYQIRILGQLGDSSLLHVTYRPALTEQVSVGTCANCRSNRSSMANDTTASME